MRGVLQQPAAAARGELGEPLGVERATIEMDTDDADSALAPARRGLGRIEVEGRLLDIAEHRHAAGEQHRFGGREEAECGHQHLVAGFETERAQRDGEGVGAIGDADDLAGFEKGRELALERRDLGTENVGVGCEHGAPTFGDGGFDPAAAAGEVEIGDRCHGSGGSGRRG